MDPYDPDAPVEPNGGEKFSGGKGSKSGPKKIITRERMRQVLELRRAGATLQTIADRLGYKAPSSVHKVLKTAMREILREPAEELRKLEYERLEYMTLALWPQVQKGHIAAVGQLIRVMERKAKLLGLDAPTVHAVQGSANAPPVRVESNVDLSKLSSDDLRELQRILTAGAPVEALAQAEAKGADGHGCNGHCNGSGKSLEIPVGGMKLRE